MKQYNKSICKLMKLRSKEKTDHKNKHNFYNERKRERTL